MTYKKKDAFLQLVLDNIPSYAFWKDVESKYLGCNLNFAISAGLKLPAEIIGKSDYDLPWSKEQSDFYRKVDKEIMDSKKAQINFEEPQTISNGKTKWVRTSKIPLFNKEENVVGILGTYEDITARKNMELALIKNVKELKELNSKLEMANTDLERFAYATSHDLQEPLLMIQGFSNHLHKKYANIINEKDEKCFSYIMQGTKRMSSLIRQIFNYTELEKTQEQFIKEDINIAWKKALKELSSIIEVRNVEIKANLPNEKISYQPEGMKILFQNIVSNGIMYNDSKNPKIEVDFEENEMVWHFIISDNGIGINNKFKDAIFKPFVRLNTRKTHPGNGIGLSICKRIVHLHGGEIYFAANQNKGTSFHFTILKTLAN